MWSMDDLDLLASDLDSSLTGLGNSPFDMSDTLSAIQVIKFNNGNDENHRQEQHYLTFSNSFHTYLNKDKAKSVQDLSLQNFSSSSSTYTISRQETRKITKKPCWKQHEDTCAENVHTGNEPIESSSYNILPGLYHGPVFNGSVSPYCGEPSLPFQNSVAEFQYILAAPTALGIKLGEETLTYMNQGQSYEIRLKKLHGLSEMKGKLLKSILHVIFHDRRLQFREKLELIAWQNQRPSERILDIDLSLSYGIFDVIPDRKNINRCEFMWDPTREASVFLKVNCISTEFTCKRRGGEKGVPFRILIETYSHWENPQCKLDAASCLIKVFKSKGADRKHKTDREKFEKLPQAEQRDLQPSYKCTVFTCNYSIRDNYAMPDFSESLSPASMNSSIDIKQDFDVASPSEVTTSTPSIASNPYPILSLKDSNEEVFSSSPDNSSMPASPARNLEEEYLTVKMNVDQVHNWLTARNFTKYLQYFLSYSAKELLCLTREDLIEICGPADGIRLYNCFHIREPPPLRKFYVSRDKTAFHALYLHSLKLNELKDELSKALNLSSSYIGNIYLAGPDGILIVITDKVLQNIKDEAVFVCEILRGEDETCTIVLNPHKNVPSHKS